MIVFIERFCYVPEGGKLSGKSSKLLEWQKDVIRQICDNPTAHGAPSSVSGEEQQIDSLRLSLARAHLVSPLARNKPNSPSCIPRREAEIRPA